jgi:hypothetical protein
MTLSSRSCAVVDVGAVDDTGGATRGGIGCRRVGDSRAGLLGVKLGAIGLIGIERGGEGSTVGIAGPRGDMEALTNVIGEEYILC